MEHDYNKALTKDDLYELVFDEVCNKFGYDRTKAKDLIKNNDQFRQRVGDSISPFLRGRATPLKKSKLGEGEGQRCCSKRCARTSTGDGTKESSNKYYNCQ